MQCLHLNRKGTPHRKIMAVNSKRLFSFCVIRYDAGLTKFLMLYFFDASIILWALYIISAQLSVDAKSSSWNFGYCNGNPASKLNIWQKWMLLEIDEPLTPWESISVNKLKYPCRKSVYSSFGNWQHTFGWWTTKVCTGLRSDILFAFEIFRRKIEG